MGIWAALGTAGRVAVMAFGGAATVGAGYTAWRVSQPDVPVEPAALAAVEGAEPEGTEPVAAAPEVASEAPVETAAVAEPEAAPVPEVIVDTWRVAADGAATVAGRAAPDALVKIMVDGAVVAEAKANGAGDFAALFTLAANPEASLMTLVAVLVDGSEVAGKASIAIAPILGPQVAVAEPAVEVVAEAEVAAEVAPEAAPEPVVAEQPAAVMLTEEGAVVLQEPAVGAEALVAEVSIDTIAYTAAGAVQLGGRGTPGAFVRLYLDNAPLQTVLIPDAGQWFTTLKEVPPGVYTLRADQIDDTGAVTSRFETPFKRETLEALAAAATPDAVRVAESGPEPVAVAEGPAEPAAEGAVVVADVGEAETRPAQDEGPVVVAEDEAAPAEPGEAPVEAVAEGEAVGTEVVVPEVVAAEPEGAEPAELAPVVADAPAVEVVGAEAEPVVEAVVEAAAPAPVTVTVQPGHTLWAIAEGQMGDGIQYVQVWEANKDAIRDPDLIYPGQVFTMPSGG
jgi:nucleoid-associated protein YgaU